MRLIFQHIPHFGFHFPSSLKFNCNTGWLNFSALVRSFPGHSCISQLIYPAVYFDQLLCYISSIYWTELYEFSSWAKYVNLDTAKEYPTARIQYIYIFSSKKLQQLNYFISKFFDKLYVPFCKPCFLLTLNWGKITKSTKLRIKNTWTTEIQS